MLLQVIDATGLVLCVNKHRLEFVCHRCEEIFRIKQSWSSVMKSKKERHVWRRERKCEPPSQLEKSSDRWHHKAHLDSLIISILGFGSNWTDRKNILNATQMSVVWFWIRSELKQTSSKFFIAHVINHHWYPNCRRGEEGEFQSEEGF